MLENDFHSRMGFKGSVHQGEPRTHLRELSARNLQNLGCPAHGFYEKNYDFLVT